MKTRTAKETRVAAGVGEIAWWARFLEPGELDSEATASVKSCAGQAGAVGSWRRLRGTRVIGRHMATSWYASAKSIDSR